MDGVFWGEGDGREEGDGRGKGEGKEGKYVGGRTKKYPIEILMGEVRLGFSLCFFYSFLFTKFDLVWFGLVFDWG